MERIGFAEKQALIIKGGYEAPLNREKRIAPNFTSKAKSIVGRSNMLQPRL